MSNNPFISNGHLITPFHVNPGEPGIMYIRMGVEDKEYFEEVFARSGSSIHWMKQEDPGEPFFSESDKLFLKQNLIKL